MVLTLGEACKAVLETADPAAKLMRARSVARDWRLRRLEHRFDTDMPDYPARPAQPELLAPRFMPKRRRAGSVRGRIAMLHALAHIEFTRDGKYALASLWERKDDGGALVVLDAATFKEVKRIPMDKPVGKYNLFNKITRSAGTSH